MGQQQTVLRAGRELDLLIAQQVLGHGVVKQKSGGGFVEGTPRGTRPLASYSKDISAAWELAEKLGITLIPIEDGTWFAMIGPAKGWKGPAEFLEYLQSGEFKNAGAAVSESAPLAICLAAVTADEKRRALQGENLDNLDNNVLPLLSGIN